MLSEWHLPIIEEEHFGEEEGYGQFQPSVDSFFQQHHFVEVCESKMFDV